MSNLPMLPTERLSKLLPRLASTYDAEVIAVARAIDRTLKAAGRDLNDLAALIRNAKPVPIITTPPSEWEWNPPPEMDEPDRWGRLLPNERVMALDRLRCLRLSEWERGFVTSIDDLPRQRPSARVSDRQAAILDRLLARAWREDRQERADESR